MKTAAIAVTAVTAALIGVLAVYVARRRRVAGGAPLAVVLAAGALGYGAYAMELWSTGPARQRWGDAKYLGVAVVTLAFLAFNLAYTGRRRWLTRRLFGALAVVPVGVVILLAIPASHNWVRHYSADELHAAFGTAQLGPVGVLYAGYSAIVVLVATGLTVVTLARISRLYRRQVTVLVAALSVPWLLNLLFDFSIGPFRFFDPTAEAFLLAGAVLVWGVFRFRLVDLAPLAMAKVVEQMPEAVIVLDAYERMVDLNPAGQALLSTTKADAVGRPLRDMLRWPGDLIVPATSEITITEGLGSRDYEAAISPLSSGPGDPAGGHLVVIRDITERKAAQTQLERMAHHDLLTGLPNRMLFDDRFEVALAAARRHLEPLAVAYLDLDGFKRINDASGHDVGDSVLLSCAQRLTAAVRGDDTVSRRGGDEFVVLLAQVESAQGALRAATKLLEALTADDRAHPLPMPLSASIGVALWPDHGSDQRTLMRAADEAMYHAKRHGGNHVVLAAATDVDALDDFEMADELRRGLARHQLHAFFQPVVTLAGEPAIMQAELCWQHPRRGLLPTTRFRASANQSGLRRPLRRLMLSEACHNTAVWERRLGRQVPVSVRLGRRDFTDTSLVGEVDAVLAADAVDARRLVVEFADGQSRAERDALLPALDALKERDVRLTLAGFGSGPTPMQRLLHLPLDHVKLDVELIVDAVGHLRARRLLASTIDLAHQLDLSVVGQSVEGSDHDRLLTDLGCDLILRRTGEAALSSADAAAWLRSP